MHSGPAFLGFVPAVPANFLQKGHMHFGSLPETANLKSIVEPYEDVANACYEQRYAL
jgi:hypothetical protein